MVHSIVCCVESIVYTVDHRTSQKHWSLTKPNVAAVQSTILKLLPTVTSLTKLNAVQLVFIHGLQYLLSVQYTIALHSPSSMCRHILTDNTDK
jgi:hypothetical protein